MRSHALAFAVFCMALGAIPLWGQSKESQPTPPSSGATSTDQYSTGPGLVDFYLQEIRMHEKRYRQLPNLTNERNAPHFVHGRVTTDHGDLPSEWVDVTLRCGGGFLRSTFADRNGHFTFDARSDPEYRKREARNKTAGGYGYSTRRPLYGTGSVSCSLQVDSPGYRSAQLELPDIRRMGKIELGILELQQLEGVTGTVVTQIAQDVPQAARNAFNKGFRALRRDKPLYQQGSAHLEKAVRTYPEFSAAWTALGEARLGLEDSDGARSAFLRAIEVDPKFLPAYERLMELTVVRMEWQDLESLSRRYIALSPNSVKGLYLSGVAAVNTLDFPHAEQMAQRIGAQDDEGAAVKSQFLMAMVYEGRSEFAEAAELYQEIVGQVDRRISDWIKSKLRKWKGRNAVEPRPTSLQSPIATP